MNSQEPSLFPEDELRQHLKWVADQPPNPAFEAAVLARIQRRKQRAALALAGAVTFGIVLLALGLLGTALSQIAPEITRTLPQFANSALVWISYAPSLAAATWQQLLPLLALTLAAVFTAFLLLEISALLILNHRKIRS